MSKKPEILKGPGGVNVGVMPPSYDIGTAVQIHLGPPKCGKTSTIAAVGKVAREHGIEEIRPFFIPTEPGTQGVEVECTTRKCDKCNGTGKTGRKTCPICSGLGAVRHVLETREELDQWIEFLADSPYNPIVFDTAEGLQQIIADDICARKQIPSLHYADDHGATWTDLFNEFRAAMGCIIGAGKGIWFVMHVYTREKRLPKSAGGGVIYEDTFQMTGKTQAYLEGLADQILKYEIIPSKDTDRHVISVQAKSNSVGGDRWDLLPELIERGNSAEEAAYNLMKCYYDI